MKPWRQIAQPHRDVLEGTFRQSEFAADITQVARGTASPEYQDAEKFFARTYITEGMRLLLISVARRLAGRGGDPVVQLQTSFGGGKTHTLLAVYHLARHAVPTDCLQGIPALLDEAGIPALPRATVAVIDGNDLAPNQPAVRGVLRIRTVWGHLAHQLLGPEGYAMVADSDLAGTSPGKEIFTALLKKAAPCVLLLDELVAFYRQLDGSQRMTAGTLESNMSFIQVLTESAKAVPEAIVLASLPESDTEAVGSYGKNVLDTLEKYFGRVENVWKPVASDESFEIVRRRLFDRVGDDAAMDEVCREFADFYRQNRDRFPPEVQEGVYAERLRRSYPIHPEIFDRLYQDWSTLDKFQKTRGVLQYLAIVIHRLWNSGDQDPLIMPGSIPLEDGNVRDKSTHYLPPGWDPVIETEIDGPASEPARIDGADTRFGAVFAARRAARTIFLGSAPASASRNRRGIAQERILLGCALPGQILGVYEDVLKRLRDRLHYLYAEGDRLWFDTCPNLRREMETRKARIEPTLCDRTLHDLAVQVVGRGDLFSGVHVFTPHADIPDDIGKGPRLVVLPPKAENAYFNGDREHAFRHARAVLESRGEQPRQRRNRLFFLAPDLHALGRVDEQCRTYLAWKEICRDIDDSRLNLDTYRIQSARRECSSARVILEQVLRECYCHLMVPVQDGTNKVTFDVRRVAADPGGCLAAAVEHDLLESQEIVQCWSPIHLKRLLEESYFQNGAVEVSARKVWQDCATFYYMPRLLDQDVFERALAEGVGKGEFFGYADGKAGDQYLGFRYGQVCTPNLDENSLLIECRAAEAYGESHGPKTTAIPVGTDPGASSTGEPAPGEPGRPPAKPGEVREGEAAPAPGAASQNCTPDPPARQCLRHFYGSAYLDPLDAASQFQVIMEEIVRHFTEKPGVNVLLHLDIDASSKTPFDDVTIRAVEENSAVLKLKFHEFDEE